MVSRDLLRGQVWSYRFTADLEPKPALIVSNDERNRSRYPKVHVVRITNQHKPPLASIVELSGRDPVTGRAMCDEVEPVDRDELEAAPFGGMPLSRATMERIDHALRLVFDLA